MAAADPGVPFLTMFDARFFAFVGVAALLVVSPGATMAVVLETAIAEGRRAALYTVAGVNIGNSSLALASALGMSAVFGHWPWALWFATGGGAAFLTCLGGRGIWKALRPGTARLVGQVPADAIRRRLAWGDGGGLAGGGRRPRPAPFVARGVMTNLLNPSVVLFYMTLLPQFIAPEDRFLARFMVLAAAHVSMSVVWLSIYAAVLGVLADRLSRPAVRRVLEGLTGAVLIGLGLRLLL